MVNQRTLSACNNAAWCMGECPVCCCSRMPAVVLQQAQALRLAELPAAHSHCWPSGPGGGGARSCPLRKHSCANLQPV